MDASQWVGVALVFIPILSALILGLATDAAATVKTLGALLCALAVSGVMTYGIQLAGWLE